jgi:Cu/Ag efflux protein CusF
MRRTSLLVVLACAFLLCASAAVADDRPHEGKVISIDKDAMTLVVQGDKDDQWVLSWTESTKLKGDVTVPELKVGDAVHFEFTEKDGKKWLTELKRTDRGKS